MTKLEEVKGSSSNTNEATTIPLCNHFTALKPLLSHSTAGEFNSPPNYLKTISMWGNATRDGVMRTTCRERRRRREETMRARPHCTGTGRPCSAGFAWLGGAYLVGAFGPLGEIPGALVLAGLVAQGGVAAHWAPRDWPEQEHIRAGLPQRVLPQPARVLPGRANHPPMITFDHFPPPSLSARLSSDTHLPST
eukprot:6825580-Pyramimonas_sp.AAC.1